MIVPILDEIGWDPYLVGLPRWQPPRRPTIVISPHPDDETLGAGGLISELRSWGTDVTVIAVTDGENAYGPSPVLGKIRQQEQESALEKLGVSAEHISRLRLQDSGLRENEDRLKQMLRALIRAEHHVIAPWKFDFHPDHESCGRSAEVVATEVNAQLSFYFFWTWHRGDSSSLDGLQLVSFPLCDQQMKVKLQAIQCHRSQLNSADNSPILPEELLAPAKRSFEVFLPR